MSDATLRRKLLLDPAAPHQAACTFIERHYTTDRVRTLLHHADTFYHWNGRCYERSDLHTIRSKVYAFLKAAYRPTKPKPVPFRANMALVTNIVDAIAAEVHLPHSITLPAWLVDTADRPPAAEMVACTNGLLHMPSGRLFSATPAFFSLNALEFEFNAAAPPPAEWLRFLGSIWDGDPEAIETLQEWFGYCLTSDTRQQKILLIVGPKRSGKGTIGRVLTGLLGQANVVAPTLAGLGQNFGQWALIGMRLAIVAEARLGGRADQSAVAERLLTISGEDNVTIDRKYQRPWTGRLGTRFAIMANELPRIADASGALASRFILLVLQRSFYGIEDHELAVRLLKELPGILNWSIAGWHRLQKRGCFRQPASGTEAIRELDDLGSPVGAFVREYCEVGAGEADYYDQIYDEWKRDCAAQGRNPGTIQSFGRALRAVVPALKLDRPRLEGGRRVRRCLGIALKPKSK